jgi:hypothetical protein
MALEGHDVPLLSSCRSEVVFLDIGIFEWGRTKSADALEELSKTRRTLNAKILGLQMQLYLRDKAILKQCSSNYFIN